MYTLLTFMRDRWIEVVLTRPIILSKLNFDFRSGFFDPRSLKPLDIFILNYTSIVNSII
jgi:hypothetical protein